MTPGAQLLEQTARLQSLSDTLGRLKVSHPTRLYEREKPLNPFLQAAAFIILTSMFCWQDEVADHVVNQQPGARVSSDFATFPSTSFVKVNVSHSVKPVSQCIHQPSFRVKQGDVSELWRQSE